MNNPMKDKFHYVVILASVILSQNAFCQTASEIFDLSPVATKSKLAPFSKTVSRQINRQRNVEDDYTFTNIYRCNYHPDNSVDLYHLSTYDQWDFGYLSEYGAIILEPTSEDNQSVNPKDGFFRDQKRILRKRLIPVTETPNGLEAEWMERAPDTWRKQRVHLTLKMKQKHLARDKAPFSPHEMTYKIERYDFRTGDVVSLPNIHDCQVWPTATMTEAWYPYPEDEAEVRYDYGAVEK